LWVVAGIVVLMAIGRLRLAWTGFTGAPGVSTFYAMSPYNARAAVWTFADAIKSLLPPDVTLNVEESGDILDPVTGIPSSTWSNPTSMAGVVGTASAAPYAAPAGACINWLTGTVVGRHRLRGKTYIVPLAQSAYENDGTLSSTAFSLLTSAANALAADASETVIWHRPTGGSGGVIGSVLGAVVTDKAAVLRSRRD